MTLRACLSVIFMCASLLVFSQEEEEITDDLGNVTDDFQQHFFEALKQKAIENYDRAIAALEKAALEKPEEAAVDYELGKNYILLEKYDAAEVHFKNALKKAGKKTEILAGLYDVYYHQQDYTAAIEIVLQLIPHDSDYKEDLANLYVRTENYTEALKLLDELDNTFGSNDYRNQLRQMIYVESDDSGAQIEDLKTRINRSPKVEQNYLNLIYLYSQENQKDKAFETAEQLLKNIPQSELAHLALYKFYLESNRHDKALESMKVVLKATQIEEEHKFKVLNDFLLFVNTHPEFDSELEAMVELFAKEENNPKIFQQLANYYLEKELSAEALRYFKMALEQDPTNFQLLKNTILLQIETGAYESARQLSEKSLELFPTQPLLYLTLGVANNHLENHKNAIDALEMGIDFVIDDPAMTYDFYQQLGQAHNALGNTEKAINFTNKANALKPE